MLLNHELHFVQKLRELLNFVNNDEGGFGGQRLADQRR